MKYFLYCRKSSEDKSRQIQSIDDQKRELLRIAKERGLEVVDIIIDSKSASKLGRKGFAEMMKRIEQGEANGILCWKLDRLSRNSVDGGNIIWLLQRNIIQRLTTPERNYEPTDNFLLLYVELGMAHQDIRNLQKNVNRGMKSKIEKGWLPTKAPFGYINEKYANKGEKRILPDPENFSTLKKLWKILLKKECSLMELYRIMESKYPLVRNGKIIGFSSFDRIFRNPFYSGYFTWKGQLNEGAHKRMITFSEYEIAQQILAGARDLRKGSLQFDYKGIFRCKVCGCSITAEQHTKRIKTTGEEKTFKYYRCTHKKREIDCKEKPISESILEEQILSIIKEIKLPEEILQFGIQEMESICFSSVPNPEEEKVKKEISALASKITQATDTFLTEENGELKDSMRSRLQEMRLNKKRMEDVLQKMKKERDGRKNTIKNRIDLISKAEKVIKNGTEEQKKDILKGIGLNWEIKGKKVCHKPQFPLDAMKKANQFLLAEKERFEPTATRITKTKKLPQELITTVWSG